MRLTDTIKGVGVIDRYWRYDRLHSDTSVTEADPKPGTMESALPLASLVPQTVGVQQASLTVQTVASGYPGAGIGLGTAAEVGYWLTDTETDADLRYLDQPTKLCDWSKPSGTTIATPDQSDACSFPLSGKCLVYWFDSGGSGANHCAVWNPYTNDFDNVQALSAVGGLVRPLSAFVCVPGTERLLRVSYEATGELGNEFSDDYGATWTVYTDGDNRAYGPANASIGTYHQHRQVRAAFDGGGNLLLAGIDATDDNLHTYVSPDNGANWEQTTLTGAVLGMDCCQLADGAIGIVYTPFLSGIVTFSRMATAYDDPTETSSITLPFGNTSAYSDLTAFANLFMAVDGNGTIWVWAEDADLGKRGYYAVAASTDNGATWFSDWYIDRTPYFWSWSDTGQNPVSFRFAASAAGGLVAAAAFGDYGAGAGIGGMLKYGQWRSNPITARVFGSQDFSAGTENDAQWVGWIKPDLGPPGWTKVGAAATTLTGTGDGSLTINSGAGADPGHHTFTLGTVGCVHAQAECGVRVANDGGSAQAIGVQLQTKSSASSKRSNAIVYFQSDGYRVRDGIAGAFLGAKVLHDFTVKTHVEIDSDVSAGEVTVTLRTDGETTASVQVWTGLTTGATAIDGADVDWGHLNGATNAVSNWWYVQARTGATLDDDFDGRVATGLSTGIGPGYPIPDASDLVAERPARMTLQSGYTFRGDEYSLPISHDYALSNLFPDAEPSPDRPWRSTEVGVAQDIVVDRGADATGGSYTLLLLVMGANCRQWGLALKEDGGSTYTSLGTLDLATGFVEVGFARTGQMVVPGTGTAGSRYIQDGECDGGHIIFDPAGTPVMRKILQTVAGFCDVNATGPRVVFMVDGIDGTEPTSGDMTVVWPSGVMPIHISEAAAGMRRYLRVRCFAANDAPGGYYQAGVVSVFGLRAYGKDWGNGWEIDQQPNVVGTRDAFGTERRKPMGPDARVLTKSWDHGVKLDRLRDQTDADYIGAVGKAALAARDEVWQRLVSIWRDSDQGSQPVLVMFDDPGDGNTLTDPTKWLYCYPDGSVRMQHATGLDDEGFFLRAGPIKFVEIR